MTRHLVLQTDFGLCDGAVSAMYGVALSVDPNLKIYDLTHEIPQYNIWEGSYRLYQTITYWPDETVFVSVVDPGVGTDRLSVVAKTVDNQYIVSPDNGTLTHITENIGIVSVREIDETINRLPNSGESYTFHGRDIYAYTGARLAAGVINFEQVGRELLVDEIIKLTNPEPTVSEGVISGNIDILDIRFGNLWTNISRELFIQSGLTYGDLLEVTIETNDRLVYKNAMTYGRSFADSRLGEPLIYVNSVDKLGVAINQGSFAQAYHIGTGINWKISLRKINNHTYK
ncbi:SAM hydrolase/SAM-dependent halogenase family protein [Pseudogracilibacillus sp. SO30301A]|uniref:SAM hydrolase/SAM-dependent halogenase family protein n=1 Tax=Pseudogracilibacillus sp. SO30301A TaxID=3098291 RepID=UPI00300E6DE5